MALNQSDILEHNNPNLAVVDSDFIKGGFRTAVTNVSDLYSLSGKTDEPSAAGQLKERATFVYVTNESKYYELIDINNVGNSNGWQPLELGGSGGITGATNGLTIDGQNVKLGGTICENTYINNDGDSYDFKIRGNDLIDDTSTELVLSYGELSLNSYASPNYLKSSGYTGLQVSGTFVDISAWNPGSIYTGINIDKDAGICIQDQNANIGLMYAANYSTNGATNPRWIPDNAYVTGLTSSSGIQTANNGLTKSGTNVHLGGTLTGNTYINFGSNNFAICDSQTCFNIQNKAILLSGSTIDIDSGNAHINIGGSEPIIQIVSNNGANIAINGTNDAIITTTNGGLNTCFDGVNDAFYLGTNTGAYASIDGNTDIIDLSTNGSANLYIDGSSDTINISNAAGSGIYLQDSGSVSLYSSGGTELIVNNNGAVYSGDYSANYTARSLPDVAYVTGLTSTSGIQTANNGLIKVGTNVVLGGNPLTGNTIICSTNATCCAHLNFDKVNSTITTCSKGGCIVLESVAMTGVGGKIIINTVSGSGMTYADCYHNNYTLRSIPDVEYVDKVVDIVDVRYAVPAYPFYIQSTDNYIGVSGYTAGSCACIYLLSSPTVQAGQKVIVADIQGQALTYPITIDGNGKYINGNSATCAIINTDYGSITFLYNGYFWSAIAFVN